MSSERWIPFDTECPNCGVRDCVIYTTADEGYAYDGDPVECRSCVQSGVFSGEDVIWKDIPDGIWEYLFCGGFKITLREIRRLNRESLEAWVLPFLDFLIDNDVDMDSDLDRIQVTGGIEVTEELVSHKLTVYRDNAVLFNVIEVDYETYKLKT